MSANWRATPWCLGVALAIGGAGTARAENTALEAAKKAYQDQDYDNVTPLLLDALALSSATSEQVEIYSLLAVMHIAYERPKKAIAAYVEVLKRDPEYRPAEDASPKILAAFAAARDSVGPAPPPARAQNDPPAPSAAPAPEAAPAPLPLAVTSAPPAAMKPWWQEWWVWTATGLVAVGGTALIVWAATRPVEPPAHDFGPFPVPSR